MNMYKLYGGYYQSTAWPVSLYYNSVKFHDSWLGENQGLLMDSETLTSFASDNKLNYQKLYGSTSVITSKIGQSPVMVAGRLADSGNDSHFFIISGVKDGKVYWSDPKPDGVASMGVTTFNAFKKRTLTPLSTPSGGINGSGRYQRTEPRTVTDSSEQ